MDIQRYRVRGHWPFPVDMLRHDQSSAASPEDQAEIDRLSQDFAPDRAAFQPVEINLVGPSSPNWQRWESFGGWMVVGDPMIDGIKAIERRAREEQTLFETAMARLTDAERAVVEARISRNAH